MEQLLTWNPPFRTTSLGSPSEPNSMSLSSVALTFAEDFFFFGVLLLFLTPALRFVPPPLVDLDLLSSCACSRAASFASSSCFGLFFFGFSSSSEPSTSRFDVGVCDPSPLRYSLLACPLVVGGGVDASWVCFETSSNLSRIKALTASLKDRN